MSSDQARAFRCICSECDWESAEEPTDQPSMAEGSAIEDRESDADGREERGPAGLIERLLFGA